MAGLSGPTGLQGGTGLAFPGLYNDLDTSLCDAFFRFINL
jgi:hypothetical protein